MIGHPPCTRLANSGVRWLAERDLWDEMLAGAEFFNKLKNANLPRIALENPIPHAYATDIIGTYSQMIHPWMFGHGVSKSICLWLKDLPPLTPTNVMIHVKHSIHTMSPSPNRAKERARFYTGIAQAMATQWGSL